MNVYIESNFVLELALQQEQARACEWLLSQAQDGRFRLVVPAFALTEPLGTLTRRHRERRRLKQDLDTELKQLARTVDYQDRLENSAQITQLLLEATEVESRRLQAIQVQLANAAEIVSLNQEILLQSHHYMVTHALSGQDALILAAVLHHLETDQPLQACFLNRNSRDFDDPDIVELLAGLNCKLLPQFDIGRDYLHHRLSATTDP